MSIKRTNFIPFLKAKTYLKEELDDKFNSMIAKSNTVGFVKNDGSITESIGIEDTDLFDVLDCINNNFDNFNGYIFYDDASVNRLSTLFGNHISLRNSGTGTVGYNANGYYTLTNTKNSAEAFIEFPLLQGIYNKSFKVTARSQGTTTERCPIGLYYYLDDNNWGGVKDEIFYLWTSAKTNGTFTENSITIGNSNNVEVVSEFIFDVDENTLTVNDYVGGVLKGTKSMTVPVTLTSSVKWGTTTAWASNTSRNLYEIKAEYL